MDEARVRFPASAKSGFARGRGIDTPNLHFDGGLAQMVERSLSISGVIAQR
jgi:hypothetical protein